MLSALYVHIAFNHSIGIKIVVLVLMYYVWQSQVEIEHFSVLYFDCVTVFEAL